jgi:hypothetical protein
MHERGMSMFKPMGTVQEWPIFSMMDVLELLWSRIFQKH